MHCRYQFRFGTLLIGCAILVPAAIASAAQLFTIAQSAGGPNNSDSQISGQAHSESSGARGTMGRASAQYGILRAFGQATDPPSPPPPQSQATGRAVATWVDGVTFDAPGLTGQSGTATVNFEIDGHVFASSSSADGRATYAFQVQLNPITIEHNKSAVYQVGFAPEGSDFMNTPISTTFPITFGAKRTWNFSISAEGSVHGFTADATGLGDLGSTALWQGISEVRDSSGNLVGNYTLTSESGTNWRQAVPEPGVMLMAGVAAMLAGLRRRRN